MAQCFYRSISFKIPESIMSYNKFNKFVKESFAGDNSIYYKDNDQYFTRIICEEDFTDAIKQKVLELYIGKVTIEEIMSKKEVKPIVAPVSIPKPKMICCICNKIIVNGNTIQLKCGHNAHDKCEGTTCHLCEEQKPIQIIKPLPLPEFMVCDKCHIKVKTDAYEFHLKRCFLCAICLEQTEESDRYFLLCGNFFHRACWDTWRKSGRFNKKCPVCGFQIND